MANATYNVYNAPAFNQDNLDLNVYQLLSAGTTILAGFFVDSQGNQIGNNGTYSVTSATVVSFDMISTAFNGTTVPPSACGFKCSISGSNLYYGQGLQTGITMAGANYPFITPYNNVTFGRTK